MDFECLIYLIMILTFFDLVEILTFTQAEYSLQVYEINHI